jgi:hypothetical protein
MKHLNRARLASTLMVGALLGLGSMAANAATTAGTDVSNTATVAYKVGTVDQTPVTSNTVTFKVDAKLILSVVKQDASAVVVNTQPGSTTAATTFTVTNEGNQAQDAVLSAVNMAANSANPFGGNSNLAIATSTVYADSNSNGIYDPATDTTVVTVLSNLAAGASKTVFVVATIPTTATDAQVAVVGLLAKVGTAGSGTALASDDHLAAWTPGAVQNIFAEAASAHPATGDGAAFDGAASDLDAYQVKSASLTIAKTSSVISDPTGSSTPHAIPGAVVEYTITVTNAAGSGATASSVAVSDDLSTEIANGHLAYNAGSIVLTAPNLNGGAATGCTDATDGDTCAYDSTTHKVSAAGIDLTAGQVATAKFTVTIQ